MFPNDIFSPSICEAQYRACATNEQVQVFLWQQLAKLKQFTYDMYQTQLSTNQGYDERITSNTNKIDLVTATVNTLKSNMTTLDAAMQQLRTDYNNFTLGVDATLNLYQTTINTITKNLNDLTVDQQALQNRVGILESQTDLAKLQEIIKTYQQILDSVNLTIAKMISEDHDSDEFKAAVQKVITDSTHSGNTVDDKLATYSQVFSLINGLEENVNTTLALFEQRLKNTETKYVEFQGKINQAVADNEAYMREKLDQMQEEYQNEDTKLSHKIDDNYKELNDRIDKTDETIDRLNTTVINYNEASINRDGVLQGNIDHLQEDLTALIKKNEQESKDRDTNLDNKIDANWNKHQTDIENLMASDTRQWETINNAVDTANNASKTANDIHKAFYEYKDSNDETVNETVAKVENLESYIPNIKSVSELQFKHDFTLEAQTVTIESDLATFLFTRTGTALVCTVKTTVKDGYYLFKPNTNVMVTGGTDTYSPLITALTNASVNEYYIVKNDLTDIIPAKLQIIYSPVANVVSVRIFNSLPNV